MGGYGSGRCSGSSKVTTESQHRIDIRWLKKQGCLKPGAVGVLSWARDSEETGSIHFRMETGRMTLNYRHCPKGGKGGLVKQIISFEQTPCNYGGYRVWFLCPRCGKRVVVLYGAGKYFFCRHCYELTYASQQENIEDRLMRRTRKIRERLRASDNLTVPILFKPKGMHQRTFDRLRREADNANLLSLVTGGRRLGLNI